MIEALLAMSEGTCAYCERPVSSSASGLDWMVVAHHRPTWGAVGVDGEVDTRAYWWLTYEWTNLFPSCVDCVRIRGTRFPVLGARATNPAELADEQALLLDPIDDDVDLHLRFEADGTVTALTERGRTTYELLGLNRDTLVTARRAMVRRVTLAGPDLDDASFGSLQRQLAQAASALSVDVASVGARPGDDSDEASIPASAGPSPVIVATTQRLAGPSLPPTAGAEPGAPAYDLSLTMAGQQRANYFVAAQWIERVVIKNFRPIRDLEIDLARSSSDRGPWTVLLGENGSGKSSILHAIALTLMGGDQRRALAIDARKYLRHRARKGLVQVYLSGRTEPLELRWATGDTEFTGPEQVPALLLAYGATRLLPQSPDAAPDLRMVRVDNLFDPLLPLTDPTSWLRSLDDDTFADVADGIHELLALGPDAALVRTGGKVVLGQGRDKSELSALSDGYQSMVVMACDILRSVMTLWQQPTLAEGIVLIDEVGAHLHPRWRLRIVTAMRNLMPRVQFVITTHDPLCLRGVVDGEVVVIRRNSDGDVVSITDLPPVTGMRIDQLLTSEHFGLGSTDDPVVADLWEEYYDLQGRATLTDAQTQRLDHTRARLDELEQFGTTERDRLVLTAASKYIAERREVGDAIAQTSDDVSTTLSKLWSKHLGTP